MANILKGVSIHRNTPMLEPLSDKVGGLQASALLKRDSSTDVFLWVLQNF